MGKEIRKDEASLGLFSGAAVGWVKGDFWVKLTALIWGAGYLARKQITKGLLAIALEVVAVYFTINYAIDAIKMLPSLGDAEYSDPVYNPVTMKNEVPPYDNSFLILLFGVGSIIILLGFFLVWVSIIREARDLEIRAKGGHPINNIWQDIRDMFDKKFHLTLLAFPCLGIIVFTVVPLIFMICIAFTNYDKQHLPPGKLFDWVGFDNFKSIFTNGLTDSFGYAFAKILTWTLIWAVFATFTTYIGGIMLSLLINNKHTKLKKMWRTFFVISIAVPQFVSLLLVRNFFRNSGIVNTLLNNWGVTEFLGKIGLVDSGLGYIPFLTDPNWIKVMVILINIWIGVPYLMLIASGVLMNIPAELYESAKIDGANAFQTFRKITMPYMLSVTGPYLITSFVGNINNFNVIYLLTKDVYTTQDQMLANARGTEVDLLVTWLYKLTRDYTNYKMASVIGIMIFVVCSVFTLIAFNMSMKGDKEGEFKI